MRKRPIVWTIAGIDPSCLAGAHTDIETIKNFDVHACSIITAITAQNASTVTAIGPVPADHVAAQCETLLRSFRPDAIKIGMLGEQATYEKIVNFMIHCSGKIVLDPILASTSGVSLIASSLKDHINNLIKLFPYVEVLTPNQNEAEAILNCSITSHQDIQDAAHALLVFGVKNVILKGGHFNDALFSQDYWTNGVESFWVSNQRSPEKNYRGTGCAFSSAIAACLALGHSVKDAIVIAKMYVNRGIRQALEILPKTAKLFHHGWPETQIDLPYLSHRPLIALPRPFKRCRTGLYPIVDNSRWLETLLLQGVKYIQLRIKDTSKNDLEKEIKHSIFLSKKYGAKLFINDYWELAIYYGAEGVHLGQEDLSTADIDQIYDSGLYLGISTHCYQEVARAHTMGPSYIACGPIYPTTSKMMRIRPQGTKQLAYWRKVLDYPLVAIGGINVERLSEVLKTGVDGVSLMSAVTQSNDPSLTVRQLLAQINGANDE